VQTETIGDRIQHILWLKYQNDRIKFCYLTGIRPGSLGSLLRNHRTPGHDFYCKLLKCNADISVTWIITGYGEMLIPDVMGYRMEIEQLKNLNEFLRKNRF
jgi:hypothetical protein